MSEYIMNKLVSAFLGLIGFFLPFIKTGERHRWASGVILIAANVIPAIGVLFLDWSGAFILIVYWAESAIIGLFNVIRILVSGFMGDNPGIQRLMIAALSIFLSMFFLSHYGAFMFGHLMFLTVFFFPDAPGDGNPVPMALWVLKSARSLEGFIPSLIFIMINQTWLFWRYFLKGKEYFKNGSFDFMLKPYGRIIVMQISIIIGGFIVMLTGWSAGMVILWVVMKTVIDLRLFSFPAKKTGVFKMRTAD